MQSQWEPFKVAAEEAARQNNFAEAERNWLKALDCDELCRDDPRVFITLDGIAEACVRQGKIEEAERWLKRSVGLKVKALGQDHMEVAQSLNNLAAVYFEIKKYADVEPIAKRVLDIYTTNLGPEHPKVVVMTGNLAMLYQRLGNYPQASRLYRQALAMKSKTMGEDHPEVLALKAQLSDIKHQTITEAVCEICGRPYAGQQCLKCTGLALKAIDVKSR